MENIDLVTPNRLILGRNNNRSPTGNFVTISNLSTIINENTRIYDTWFQSWLLHHVIKVGDVVLFCKVDNKISSTCNYGMITKVERGNDGKVRKVLVKYRNENENVFRETTRSVRNLVLIHSVDECDLMEEIASIAQNVDQEQLSSKQAKEIS